MKDIDGMTARTTCSTIVEAWNLRPGGGDMMYNVSPSGSTYWLNRPKKSTNLATYLSQSEETRKFWGLLVRIAPFAPQKKEVNTLLKTTCDCKTTHRIRTLRALKNYLRDEELWHTHHHCFGKRLYQCPFAVEITYGNVNSERDIFYLLFPDKRMIGHNAGGLNECLIPPARRSY
jgi:hypothetical protein